MIIVTGRTFDMRSQLAREGGRWNADKRQWEFDYIGMTFREELQNTVGIVVYEEKEQPRPKPIHQPSYALIDEILNRRQDKQRPENTGKTHLHGDDAYTYLNYFAPGKPIVHFGFSSLAALTKYLNDLPRDRRNSNGWDEGNMNFTGVNTMGEAITLARNGWLEGVKQAEEISNQLLGNYAQQKRRKHSVMGGSVNVSRLLAGDPLHMRSRPKQPGKKVVTLFAEAGSVSVIEKNFLLIRASMIAAIVDLLEMNGYQCEIIATDFTKKRNNRSCSQLTVKLKEAGEPLNLNEIVFGLGHPAFARRMLFACVGSDEALRDIWETQGWPDDAFTEDHPPRPNEFFINNIQLHEQKLLDSDDDLMTTVEQMWKFLIPPGFPIEFTVDERNDHR